jgi:hypothetical protein
MHSKVLIATSESKSVAPNVCFQRQSSDDKIGKFKYPIFSLLACFAPVSDEYSPLLMMPVSTLPKKYLTEAGYMKFQLWIIWG